jgi:hypothetical protein
LSEGRVRSLFTLGWVVSLSAHLFCHGFQFDSAFLGTKNYISGAVFASSTSRRPSDCSSPSRNMFFFYEGRRHRALVPVQQLIDHITTRDTFTLAHKLKLKEPPPSDWLTLVFK